MGNSGRMAYLRKLERSPFWQLRRRDLDTGKWVEHSTGLRHDNASDTRKAQRACEKATSAERQLGATANNPAFAVWVPGYIATHWQRPESKRRYATAWQAIKRFLNENGITYPRQIKYAHGDAFLRWRKATPVHGRAVGHNSALLEVKFLSQLVNEAIRREFCESNPIARLGVARKAAKVKPELTDEQIKLLRSKLSGEPEWMRVAFEISLYTGCRFGECEIPLENIDLEAGSIRIRDSKRGDTDPRKYFTVPIHPSLRPTLVRLRESGVEVTCRLTRDKNGRINYFFRQCGVAASFHSLRVTFITRCHRAGLSETDAMRLVNHSSQLVHRIYSRLNVDDVRQAQARIQLPSFDEGTP